MNGYTLSYLIGSLVVCLMLSACTSNKGLQESETLNTNTEETVQDETDIDLDINPSSSLSVENESIQEDSKQVSRVKVTFGDRELIVRLEDNSASRDLLQRLPLTVSFEDYNSTEKIAYMVEELDISDAPGSCQPTNGTFAYYAPWGNLSIFYEDFRESNQLIPLGSVEEGIENIEYLDGVSEVLIEVY